MDYGSIGVFIGSFIEEVIAPIPSTLVIITSSFFMLEGQTINPISLINLLLYIALPVALGMTLGSLVIYALCYYLGKPFVTKWGKYFTLNWERIEDANQRLEKQKSTNLAIFLIRAIPVIPSVVISAFCGIIRYDIKKYLTVTFLGGLVRAIILGFIGWQFGNMYTTIAAEISYLEEITIAIIIITLISYIIYRKYKKK